MKLRVAGIDFDHMHMGDNLAFAFRHPEVEVVAICDERRERMADAVQRFGIPRERVFTDWRECLECSRPDLVILCPATGEHALWTERVAEYGVHVLMEKPFAANLSDADRMVAAVAPTGKRLAINWPLRWVPAHATAQRMVAQGRIGELIEVHYYDGNRGPLWHLAHKQQTTEEFVAGEKLHSWFYRKARGGGSLLDYLGYGTTLGTWFLGGRVPLEVTCVVDQPHGLEVDEHSITVARYAFGLSKFETRWGTFTDPWVVQPQPQCGFVLRGTEGTIASYDYEPNIRVQTRSDAKGSTIPAETLVAPFQDPVQYFVHCIQNNLPVEGPLDPHLSRIGQQIVDTACQSSIQKQTLPLCG